MRYTWLELEWSPSSSGGAAPERMAVLTIVRLRSGRLHTIRSAHVASWRRRSLSMSTHPYIAAPRESLLALGTI